MCARDHALFRKITRHDSWTITPAKRGWSETTITDDSKTMTQCTTTKQKNKEKDTRGT